MLQQLLAPARAAGILQMIFGGLLALMGTCLGSMLWVVPLDEVVKQIQLQNPSLAGPDMTVEMIKAEVLATAVMLLIFGGVGLALLVLGIFVRGGGRVVATISFVMNVLVGFLLLMGMLNSLGKLSSNVFTSIFALMFLGSLTGLCAATIAKLIETIRQSANIADLRAGAGASPVVMPGPEMIAAGFGYPPPPPAGATPVGVPQPAPPTETTVTKPDAQNPTENPPPSA
jgi:hypothetical protein